MGSDTEADGRNKLDQVWNIVNVTPGIAADALACQLGIEVGLTQWLLVAMEKRGLLLSEDDNGGLHPFRHVPPIKVQRPDQRLRASNQLSIFEDEYHVMLSPEEMAVI